MHWKHSRFELAHIILGNCHTYDEAYRVLCELEEDRDFAIESSLAESLRAQSKVLGSKVILDDESESKAGKMLAQCNIDEQKARKVIAQPCLDEARRELDFIRLLKSKLEPVRAFRNQPDHVAHQLCQTLEWKFELHWKSFNYLCSTGTVPHDHLMLLRMHPESSTLMSGLFHLRESIQNDENFLFYSKKDVLTRVAHGNEAQRIASTEWVHKENLIAHHLTVSPEELPFIVYPVEE